MKPLALLVALSLLCVSVPAQGGKRSRATEAAAASTSATASASGAPSASGAVPTRTGIIRRGEASLTLVGPALELGQVVPVVPVRDGDLQRVTPGLADGMVRVVMTVPSLDTPTCSLQARTFNRDATDLGAGVEVLLISRDLPAAQKRFCAAEGIDRVRTLSDYEEGAWGKAWGLFVQESALLARAVTVIDGQGVLRYLQVVENQPDEPDYASALAAVRELTGAPTTVSPP